MKRWVKLVVSLALRACDVLHTAALRRIGRQARPICVALYYHAAPARHRELFARQMDLLLRVAEPVSTESPPAMQPGKRYVAVTFDDGFVSVLENAAPELKSRRIPWTMFVPSGFLGRTPAWLRNGHPTAGRDRVMTGDEIRSLARDPLVTIGSHSVNHPDFLRLDAATADREFLDSKRELEALLERPVELFSFPHGACDEHLARQARKSGYRRVFTIEPERIDPSSSMLVVGRVAVEPDDWPIEFRLKLLGAYRWLAAPRRQEAEVRGR